MKLPRATRHQRQPLPSRYFVCMASFLHLSSSPSAAPSPPVSPRLPLCVFPQRLCCSSVVSVTVMVLFLGSLLDRSSDRRPGSRLLIGGNAGGGRSWCTSLSTTAVVQTFDGRVAITSSPWRRRGPWRCFGVPATQHYQPPSLKRRGHFTHPRNEAV